MFRNGTRLLAWLVIGPKERECGCRKCLRDRTQGGFEDSVHQGFPGGQIRVSFFCIYWIPGRLRRDFRATHRQVAAFAISFPGSSRGESVEYKVNNVLWEQWEEEYGSPD